MYSLSHYFHVVMTKAAFTNLWFAHAQHPVHSHPNELLSSIQHTALQNGKYLPSLYIPWKIRQQDPHHDINIRVVMTKHARDPWTCDVAFLLCYYLGYGNFAGGFYHCWFLTSSSLRAWVLCRFLGNFIYIFTDTARTFKSYLIRSLYRIIHTEQLL